jgi:hypothetical protein
MKKSNLLFILTIAILTAITINVSGQTTHQMVNKEIFIDKKGQIHDKGGIILGFIDKDNIARDNKGKKVYFIDQNGNVIDANGKNLGKAMKNGNYYNINGVNIITIKDENGELCQILDPEGHSMGTVHKNYKLHACAAHCFFLKQEKEKVKA